jgi:Icc-related predicted phosphoesterase
MARRTRIFFATDLHGSSKCFRKFVNAGSIYGVDALVLGGDLAGKAIQTIVQQPGGRWRCSFIGAQSDVAAGDELVALEKLIEDHGYYPLRVEPGEFEQLRADGKVDQLFLDLMRARLDGWLNLADERLRGPGIPLYFMLGNDDPVELRELLDRAPFGTQAEGRVLAIDGDHELVSWGYSNLTPWNSHREQTEQQLDESIREVLAGARDPRRVILNVHVPPYGSGLDEAPVLDENLRVVQVLGQVKFAAVGSTAVRAIEEELQPLLGLHGHIHEASGIKRIGRTLAINPGSDYSTGALNGAIVTLEREKVGTYQLVRG